MNCSASAMLCTRSSLRIEVMAARCFTMLWIGDFIPSSGGAHVVADRIGTEREARIPAVARFRQAGQRLGHGRLPQIVRGGREGLRGLLGAAGEGARALAQAVHQNAG